MKKVCALLLTLALVLSLAACGSESDKPSDGTSATPTKGIDLSGGNDAEPTEPAGDTTEPEADAKPVIDSELNYDEVNKIIPKETVTLSVYSQLANDAGENPGWWAELMLKKFNVKFNVVRDEDGVFATRMEAKNLGDIVVFGGDGDDYHAAMSAGLLLDWEEDDIFEKYAPYMYALKDTSLKNAIAKNRSLNEDGIFYGVAHNVASGNDHDLFMYWPGLRYDLYAKLGYPEIKTLEDYIPVLKAMQELEPTDDKGNPTYGVSLHKAWDGAMVMYVKATAALYGYDELGMGLYNAITDEYEGCLQEGGIYFRCLKFYNTLYREGLLDPDSSTNVWDNIAENMKNGSTFFDIFNYVGEYYNTDEHTSEGKIMAPVAADDLKNLCYGLSSYGGDRIWSIGANTNYPELCMAIINYMFTPEGTMNMLYGPKGVCWDYDENSNPYLTETGISCQQDHSTMIGGGYTGTFAEGNCYINNMTWAKEATNPEGNGQSYNYQNWDSYIAASTNPAIEAYEQHYNVTGIRDYIEKNVDYTLVIGTTFSQSKQSKELKATWAQVKDTIVTNTWKAIYAKTDEEYNKIIDEMIKEANAYGYEECLKWSEENAAERKRLTEALR